MKEIDFDKGQHILIDEEVIENEVNEAEIKKNEKVIEIGAGTGILTRRLADVAGEVLAFEIDKKFRKDLEVLSEDYKNIRLIFDNALNYNWKGYDKIVSNIPYHLSEEVVNKAIKDDINELILIVGERFKELLFSNEKVGLIARKFYFIGEIMSVSKESFEPAPGVNSFLIKMEKKKEISKIDSAMLNIALGKGKVKNAIIRALFKLGKTKRESKEIISKMNLNENVLEKPAKMITTALIIRIEKEIEKLK